MLKKGLPVLQYLVSGRMVSDLKTQGRPPKYAKLSINGRTGRLHEAKRRSNLSKAPYKMNARIERYNRTAQEEFVDWHLDELGYEMGSFNYQLMDWVLWYNT